MYLSQHQVLLGRCQDGVLLHLPVICVPSQHTAGYCCARGACVFWLA